ncbi:hypothetical protein HDU76_010477 [Blyttiomyces sp. JEL0837]|nr:hypothetical protein HDU76_010477 [Blyttiomyces sp. JEL0837]
MNGIPSMRERNWQLNANFIHRLHHSTNKTNLAAKVYRELRDRTAMLGSCVVRSIRKNDLIQELISFGNLRQPSVLSAAALPDHLGRMQCTDSGIKRDIRDVWLLHDAIEMRDNGVLPHIRYTNIGNLHHTLTILPEFKRPAFVGVGSLWMPRHLYRPLELWLLGRVAHHQVCMQCDNNGIKDDNGQPILLTRQHSVFCSGADGWLLANYPGGIPNAPPHWNSDNPYTVIDRAIYKLNFQNTPTNRERIGFLVQAIERIRTRCAGEKSVHDILDRIHYNQANEANELINSIIDENHSVSNNLARDVREIVARHWDFDSDGGITLDPSTGLVGAVDLPAGFDGRSSMGTGTGRGGINQGGGIGRGGGGRGQPATRMRAGGRPRQRDR